MINPVIYIFLNKSLKMSIGKASSQAAHAAVLATIHSHKDVLKEYESTPHKTIIILEAKDDTQMQNIATYLMQRGIYVNKIIDEGINEIEPHSLTALSTCILEKDSDFNDTIFSSFKSYRDSVRIVLEVDK